MNGHEFEFSSVLRTLSLEELARLDTALTAAQGCSADLEQLVAGMLATPAPITLPDDVQWRTQADGGRGYELLLDGGDREAANAQHEREWTRAHALVATGLSYESAWAKIRGDALFAGLDGPFTASREQHRASFRHRPVARPATPARRDGAPRLRRKHNGPERD